MPRIRDASALKRIDAALQRARVEIRSMEPAERAWRNRVTDHPDVRNADGTSSTPRPLLTWVPSLTAQDSPPPLRPYGEQLAVLVTEADQAVQARSEAQRKRADFELGPRKAFVDRLNAQRQSIYGQLGEAAHARTDLGLSSDFATPFFARDTRNRQLSLSELEQSILRLRERLQRKEAELARRLEEEDLAEQQRATQALAAAEAELSAADDELAAVERQRAELAARVAALREQTQAK